MTESAKKILSQIGLFSSLTDTQLEVFSGVAEMNRYNTDESIVTESNTEDHSFLIIVNSQVKVYSASLDGREATLAMLGTGEFLVKCLCWMMILALGINKN